MNKYILSKITAIFFGTTTVIIFFMASAGAFFTYTGSVQAGVAIYIVKTVGLVVSLLVFIWFRAHKDQPKQLELQTLEAYAALRSTTSEAELPQLSVDPDTLREIQGGATKTITSPPHSQPTLMIVGSAVRLRASTELSGDAVEATIIAIDGNLYKVKPLGN